MINTLVEILATASDVLFLIWFIPKFNGVSLKERPKALIWAAVLLVFQLFADQYIHSDWVYAAIDLVLALCFSLSLKNGKRIWSAFAAFLYVIVVMLSSTCMYLVFSLFIEDIGAILQSGVLNVRVNYLLVCKIVHLLFYKLLIVIFKKDKNIDIKNSLLSFLFTITTAVGLVLLMRISTIHEAIGVDVYVLILSLVLIALNIILYTMIYQVQGLLKSKYELSLIRERMDSEKERIEEASVIWDNIRKLKHDLKNHFTVLKGKLEEGDTDSCKHYLSQLNQTVENMGDLIKSGNSVVDYLINSKLSNLDNVQVLISGYVGNYSDIEDVDLACLLGNILDNAIEAQKKVSEERIIELHFLQKNTNRIIICKNTIASSVLKNNSQLRSTKEFPSSHGLGHQIVESTVKKYQGWVDYFEEDKMFGIQIILPLKEFNT